MESLGKLGAHTGKLIRDNGSSKAIYKLSREKEGEKQQIKQTFTNVLG